MIDIAEAIESLKGWKISAISTQGGGDIAKAYKFKVDDRPYFLKFLPGEQGKDNLRCEEESLNWLGATSGVSVPDHVEFLDHEEGGLLIMQYVDHGASFDPKAFGRMLASLHQDTQDEIGWHMPNYIGRLSQSNIPHPTWATFWRQERLQPQVDLAVQKSLLNQHMTQRLEHLMADLDQRLPNHPPSKLHGDLWNGNVIADGHGRPFLIDPSCYAGDREVDIAMMHLFGGFSRDVMDAYQHHFPLERSYKARMPIYQLYYALVHVNMFGASYLRMVDGQLSDLGY